MKLNIFSDLLFPMVCPLCEKAVAFEAGFCPSCEEGFAASRINGPACRVCGQPFASSNAVLHTCGECIKNPPPFIQAISAYIYEGILHDAICAFKFNGRVHLAKRLGALIADAALFDAKAQLIMPVPLHITRLRQRGFNQSLLLSREVGAALSIPIDYDSLHRIRPTDAQSGLNAADRRLNVKGAFIVARPEVVKDKRILLIDDVLTTAATVREAATMLKTAGAVVQVLTLARVRFL